MENSIAQKLQAERAALAAQKLELFKRFQNDVARGVEYVRAEFPKISAASTRFDAVIAKNLAGVSPADYPPQIADLIREKEQLANVTEARETLREIERVTPELLWGPRASRDAFCYDAITGQILIQLGHSRGRAAAIDRLRLQAELVIGMIKQEMEWAGVLGRSTAATIEIPRPPSRGGVDVDSEFVV